MVSQPGSPLSSPTKNKKQKVSGTLIQGWPASLSLLISTTSYSSCASRNREKSLDLHYLLTCADSRQSTPGSKSQSKIPSRLRESSIVSFPEREGTAASPGSRSSTPGTAPTPASSVPGNGRPNGTSGAVEEKRIPPRIPSPPRPVTRRPETDYLVGKRVCCAPFIWVGAYLRWI